MTDEKALVGMVTVMMSITGRDIGAAYEKAKAWVAEREKAPDEPVKCPCCEKLVTLCLKHYQLREPGVPCVQCRVEP